MQHFSQIVPRVCTSVLFIIIIVVVVVNIIVFVDVIFVGGVVIVVISIRVRASYFCFYCCYVI